MKFVSAGHCNVQGPNYDPGAIGVNGRKEADETVWMRDTVCDRILKKGYSDLVRDMNAESRQQYFQRIQTGTGSTVCEFHFNAFNGKATGVEVLVQRDADKMDLACAKELAMATAEITRLPLRRGGVISEAESHHGSLQIMREKGIVVLVEICFIDNPKDMEAYDLVKNQLAEVYANILIKYDLLVQ
jgi:N-acetylmuramoyl-L-alanine amidase